MITVHGEGRFHEFSFGQRYAGNGAVNDASVMQQRHRIAKVYAAVVVYQTVGRLWCRRRLDGRIDTLLFGGQVNRLIDAIMAHEQHTRFVGDDNQIQSGIVDAQRYNVIVVYGQRRVSWDVRQTQWNI